MSALVDDAWPSVSVVMPCYNAQAFIADALQSIAAQQYPGTIEILVVDDGSIDNSVQIASEFAQVTVLQQKNAGPAAARNLGLQHAHGEVIAFLDADDLWTPDSLRCRVEMLLADADAGVVFGNFTFWTPAEGMPPSDVPCRLPESVRDASRSGWVYPEILLDPIVHIIATIVRRSVIERIGGFDTSLRTGEDYDFFIRAAHHCRFIGIDAIVARYRQHPTSITRCPQPSNNEYTVVRRAIARSGTTGPDGRQLGPQLLAQRLQRMCFDHALLHLRHGDPAIAARGFRAAIVHYPWRMKSWLFAAVATVKAALRPTPDMLGRRP